MQGASNACARSDINVQRAVSGTGVQRVCKGGVRGVVLVCNECAKEGLVCNECAKGVQGVTPACKGL